MKKLMKRLSFIAIILSMLFVDFPLMQVKALTGINQLSTTTQLTQWTLDEAANSLYAISEEGKNLLFINASTLTIDKDLPLAGSPTDIIKENGKLYIALDSINKIAVVDITTKAVVDTLATTSDPYRIVKDGNSLYYTERDQWCDTYQYDLNTRTDHKLSIESLYNPDLAINVNDHILYIGESGSSGSNMVYYSTTENKVLGKTNYDDGYGFPYPDRNTLYDGQYVYYAGYKFNPLNPTDILASYASKNILFVKQGYVCAKTALYNQETGQVVNNYPNGIDLYEISSQPMIYLYSVQDKKIVKVDPNKAVVTFNSQGGSQVPSINANKNTLLASPAAPAKTGYTFGGWYKDAGCINPWNFATDKVTGDVTLYAKWVKVVPTYSSIKAIASSDTSITVSWAAVTGASGYEIYRATSSTGTYSFITTTTSTSYNNTGLKFNTAYYYKIRAYKLVGTRKVYNDFSAVVSAKPIIAVTSSIKASSTGYSSINISWTAVAAISGYEVYRATSSTGTYSLIATVTSPSCNNSGLSTNSTYYYKVRAYKAVGATKLYGNFSTVVSAKPIPSVPSNLNLQETSNSDLLISWSAVSGASGYTIYRADSASGPYTDIKSTTTLNYTVSAVDLQLGQTYYFMVKAYRYVGTQKVYSGSSRVVYVRFYLD